MVSNAGSELEQGHLSLLKQGGGHIPSFGKLSLVSSDLLVGGGGKVEVAQEPPELHGRGVALGQAGEVVVGAGQELPQLVGDGDCQRGHWKHGDILSACRTAPTALTIHHNSHHASYGS